MASDTEIANIALSHLANSKEIQNLESDRSAEASACRRFYSPALKEVLRDFSWPFATKTQALGLVEETPNSEWAFSYRYPSDCQYFRKILSGIRNDTRQTRVPYDIGQDEQGLLIFTDQPNAEAKWTILEVNPDRYPPDFIMAFSLLLAGYIAPRVTAGDPFKLGHRALELYQWSRTKAQGNAMNERQDEELPDAEQIRARE